MKWRAWPARLADPRVLRVRDVLSSSPVTAMGLQSTCIGVKGPREAKAARQQGEELDSLVMPMPESCPPLHTKLQGQGAAEGKGMLP